MGGLLQAQDGKHNQPHQEQTETSMSPEEQRICIAEKCGWIKAFEEGEDEGTGSWFWHKGNQNLRKPPDYLNDLNACHEMEKCLPDVNALARYADELDKLCVPVHICSLTHWQATVMATAAQRCEAFLKTLNLWKP